MHLSCDDFSQNLSDNSSQNLSDNSSQLQESSSQIIIIFEGHDMTGKTEIAKALAKELGIPYFKNKAEYDKNYDSSAALKYQAPFTQKLLEATGQSIIFDRSWPSELIYSQVYERPTYKSILSMLDDRLSRMNSIIFILEKNEEDYLEDAHSMIEVEKYNAIKQAYHNFHSTSSTETHLINISEFKNKDGSYNLLNELNYIFDILFST